MHGELLLQVHPGSGYEDGDIVCAFNRRRKRCVHVQHCCHPWRATPNNDGYLNKDDHVEGLQKHTRQFECVRTGKWSMERRELATGNVVEVKGAEWSVQLDNGLQHLVSLADVVDLRKILKRSQKKDYDAQFPLWLKGPDSSLAVMIAAMRDGVPLPDLTIAYRRAGAAALIVDGVEVGYQQSLLNPEVIDLPVWIHRRRKHKAPNGATKLPIFGQLGSESWYAGRTDYSDPKLDLVWNEVETHTPRRQTEDEFQWWPAGRLELKSMLYVTVHDFDDSEADQLVDSETEEVDDPDQPGRQMTKVHAKRRRHVPWRELLANMGVNEADVLDHAKPIDRRREMTAMPRQPLVRTKPTRIGVGP